MTKLERLQERLDLYYLAEQKIIGGFKKDSAGNYIYDASGNKIFEQGTQSFTIGDTTYTRANIKSLQNKIDELEEKIELLKVKQSKKIQTKPIFHKGIF